MVLCDSQALKAGFSLMKGKFTLSELSEQTGLSRETLRRIYKTDGAVVVNEMTRTKLVPVIQQCYDSRGVYDDFGNSQAPTTEEAMLISLINDVLLPLEKSELVKVYQFVLTL